MLQATMTVWLISGPSDQWVRIAAAWNLILPPLTRVFFNVVKFSSLPRNSLAVITLAGSLYVGHSRLREGSLTPLYVAIGAVVVSSVAFALMLCAVLMPFCLSHDSV